MSTKQILFKHTVTPGGNRKAKKLETLNDDMELILTPMRTNSKENLRARDLNGICHSSFQLGKNWQMKSLQKVSKRDGYRCSLSNMKKNLEPIERITQS